MSCSKNRTDFNEIRGNFNTTTANIITGENDFVKTE